jgi:hypothetical protein
MERVRWHFKLWILGNLRNHKLKRLMGRFRRRVMKILWRTSQSLEIPRISMNGISTYFKINGLEAQE